MRSANLDPPLRQNDSQLTSVETRDVDEARAVASSAYYPHKLTPIQGFDHIHAKIQTATMGPLRLGALSYDADVKLECGELEIGYEVNVPVSGRVQSSCGGDRVAVSSGQAAVYPPTGETTIDLWSRDCLQYGIKFPRDYLEQELERLLDRPIPSPVRFATAFDVSHGRGRDWFMLIRHIADQICQYRQPLLQHHLTAEALAHAVTSGLLLTVPHEYTDELTASRPPARPPTVARAVAAIESSPEYPWRASEIAAEARCSLRSLQMGFGEHLGCSPMAYLRQVRLHHAYNDLRNSNPAETTVAAIAHRWGFSHLGRFSSYYQAKYGIHPSTTLRTDSYGCGSPN